VLPASNACVEAVEVADKALFQHFQRIGVESELAFLPVLAARRIHVDIHVKVHCKTLELYPYFPWRPGIESALALLCCHAAPVEGQGRLLPSREGLAEGPCKTLELGLDFPWQPGIEGAHAPLCSHAPLAEVRQGKLLPSREGLVGVPCKTLELVLDFLRTLTRSRPLVGESFWGPPVLDGLLPAARSLLLVSASQAGMKVPRLAKQLDWKPRSGVLLCVAAVPVARIRTLTPQALVRHQLLLQGLLLLHHTLLPYQQLCALVGLRALCQHHPGEDPTSAPLRAPCSLPQERLRAERVWR